jgi:hypothetical protein
VGLLLTLFQFFAKYNTLLVSPNYVAQRQSVKLLGEILLDRANYNIMTAYVDSPEHLKLIMNLLRDKSRNVQYEAFHVFKVSFLRQEWNGIGLMGLLGLCGKSQEIEGCRGYFDQESREVIGVPT